VPEEGRTKESSHPRAVKRYENRFRGKKKKEADSLAVITKGSRENPSGTKYDESSLRPFKKGKRIRRLTASPRRERDLRGPEEGLKRREKITQQIQSVKTPKAKRARLGVSGEGQSIPRRKNGKKCGEGGDSGGRRTR